MKEDRRKQQTDQNKARKSRLTFPGLVDFLKRFGLRFTALVPFRILRMTVYRQEPA